MKKLKHRIHRIKEAIKENRFNYIFSSPLDILLFIFLIARFIILRLIPQVSKVYFIRKDFKDKVITIPETAYNFKIFYQYPKNLNEFALSRSRENSNIFFDVYSKIIAKRLSEGMAACVLLQGEKIVSVFFTSTQNCTVEQVNYIYQPKKSELVITDIYTLIDYRRKGLYSLLLQHAINHYRKIGINVFVMWVMKHNRATIQAQLKLGFTEVFQTVNLFSWLGFEKVSVNISTNSLENL